MGVAAGIILEADGKTIYHAGDTAEFSEMQLIGENHAIDVAFLQLAIIIPWDRVLLLGAAETPTNKNGDSYSLQYILGHSTRSTSLCSADS